MGQLNNNIYGLKLNNCAPNCNVSLISKYQALLGIQCAIIAHYQLGLYNCTHCNYYIPVINIVLRNFK